MATVTAQTAGSLSPPEASAGGPLAASRARAAGAGRALLGNWKLIAGLGLILALVLFSLVGRLFVPYDETQVAAGPLSARPSAAYPLGTDNVGRNLLASSIYGILPSLVVGLIVGLVGTVVGAFLGVVAGYSGGWADAVIRSLADISLTIPSLLILVVIASYLRTTSIELTALIIALFAWAGPTRAIRGQVLSMRERGFVQVARLSGQGTLKIVVLEILPNLLPYLAAGFVGAVAGGVLALVGIQLLGLGPLYTPNLGMTLQTAQQGAALYKRMWWWWGPPTLTLMLLFVGLFLVSLALDEYANPRLRERAG
jgi:peptide/nickel transport system permease protein